MWKALGVTLLLVQFVIVQANDDIQRHTRKAAECCPCPDIPASSRDTDTSASENKHVIECPCKSRTADLEPASSLFSPTLSAIKPFARQFDKTADPKPLLQPEVGLASSVLETLREVTEEEYQDAVARDAARSAIQSVLPDEASTNLVTVVVSPDARESIDDILPEASNNQESTCILPEYENYADEVPLNSLHDGMFQRINDMTDSPSNRNSNVQIPGEPRANTPLRGSFRNSPAPWTRDMLFLPHNSRELFIPALRGNDPLRKSLLPRLDTRSLFGPWRPLDIPNLLNLRDVELIPAKKVNIARGPQIRPQNNGNKILSPSQNNGLNVFPHFNSPTTNQNQHSDCNGDGTELNPMENMDQNIHTDILNTIPVTPKPLYYNGNSFVRPQNNKHIPNQLMNAHKNFAAKGENKKDCIDDNNHKHDPLFYPRNKHSEIVNSDLKKNHLLNPILSPQASNNFDVFQHNPYNIGPSDLSRDASDMSHTFLNTKGSVVNSLRSATDDSMLNNLNINDRLRSSENDALDATQRIVNTEVCTLGNEMHPNTYKEKGRSNNEDSNSLSMKHLQKMSDSMLNNFYTDAPEMKTLPKYSQHQDNQETFRTSSDNFQNKYESSNQDVRINGEQLQNIPFEISRTNIDHEKQLNNIESCLEHDQSARNINNEMNSAASESRNTQYRIKEDPNNLFRSSLYETPLEDINLDIFRYQPPLLNSQGIRNPELPLLNMKSYKTQLPVPKALGFQPVKLQKAIQRGNDILGATLTMKPHGRKSSLPFPKNKLRSSLNPASGLKLPDIDDIREYFENNALNIHEIPFLSNLACNHRFPLSQQLGDSSNNMGTYLSENLGNTLREGENLDRNLGDAVFNPSDVIETISEAREDITDKLNTLKLNLDERLKQFHQSITGQARSPTLIGPQLQNRATNTRYNPEIINRNRGNIFNKPPSPGSNIRESKFPALRSSLNKETLNSKPPAIGEISAIPSNARINRPLTRPGLPSTPVTGIRQKPTDTKKTPSLLDRLKARESKGIISLTTTKRPPVIQPQAKPKPLLPRPSTLQSKIAQPRTIADQIGLRRTGVMKEPKTSPSEVSYTQTPSFSRTPSLSENLGRDSILTGPKPRTTLNKSLIPKIPENAFLSKIKESVLAKDARNVASNSDVIPSASEVVRHAEDSNGKTFNCKLICEQS